MIIAQHNNISMITIVFLIMNAMQLNTTKKSCYINGTNELIRRQGRGVCRYTCNVLLGMKSTSFYVKNDY